MRDSVRTASETWTTGEADMTPRWSASGKLRIYFLGTVPCGYGAELALSCTVLQLRKSVLKEGKDETISRGSDSCGIVLPTGLRTNEYSSNTRFLLISTSLNSDDSCFPMFPHHLPALITSRAPPDIPHCPHLSIFQGALYLSLCFHGVTLRPLDRPQPSVFSLFPVHLASNLHRSSYPEPLRCHCVP